MKVGKNGSAAMTSGLRPMTSPQANARPTLSERALRLGVHPSSAAAASIRARVSGATPGRSFNANETSPLLTPAARATSAMVGRVCGGILHSFVSNRLY